MARMVEEAFRGKILASLWCSNHEFRWEVSVAMISLVSDTQKEKGQANTSFCCLL
jgi:hypothetical protein